jgi:hypothetical protein
MIAAIYFEIIIENHTPAANVQQTVEHLVWFLCQQRFSKIFDHLKN